MFRSATTAFGERVHAVHADQQASATPDSDWTVADLVEHVIDAHRWMSPLLHGLDFDACAKVVEDTRGAGVDLAESWDKASTTSVDAVLAEGVLDSTVALSRGATDARVYLDEMIIDATVHAWDLGTAIGFDSALPDDLVDYVYARIEGAGDLSEAGLFREPVEVAEDASTLDKLLGATGRDPRG